MKLVEFIVSKIEGSDDIFWMRLKLSAKFAQLNVGSLIVIPTHFKKFREANEIPIRIITKMITKKIKSKYNKNIILKPRHLNAFIILHELGHQNCYCELGYYQYKAMMIDDNIPNRFDNHRVKCQIEYRRRKLEMYADNYAIDKLYELFFS